LKDPLSGGFEMKKLSLTFALLLISLVVMNAVNAQKGTSVVRRITFPRGQTTAEVQGSLRRGTSHDYLIRARRGQGMAVRVISQGNLAFQVIAPSGQFLSDVTVEWGGYLPQSGDYRINVLPDPTTNRAYRYTLEVSIQ
jgi:hypothetical protein